MYKRTIFRPCKTHVMSEASHKKVIVIGDGCVGKTCFLSKVTENRFIPHYTPTFGGKTDTYILYRTYSTAIDPFPTAAVEYGVKTIKRGDHEVKLKVNESFFDVRLFNKCVA